MLMMSLCGTGFGLDWAAGDYTSFPLSFSFELRIRALISGLVDEKG